MISKRMIGAVASALILGGLAAVVGAAPSNAATKPDPICPTWKLRSIVAVADGWQDAAPGSVIADGGKVVLVKPQGGGTEFAAFDLDHVADGDDITVSYKLAGGASSTGGAVRLFFYAAQDADTLNVAPDGVAVADGDEGVLKIANVSGPVGTVGLVYDASNSAGGSVVFTGLTVGKTKVKFKGKCPSPSVSPSPSESPSPLPSVSASASPSATATASVPPAGAGGGDEEPSLPVTGASLPVLVAGGGALLAVGVVALLVARARRRMTFSAE